MKFYKPQLRIALRNCGFIDPENIGEYIARDGYAALAKVLGMQPDHVLQEIIDSGLRGRGGGGFPTGLKWKITRDAKADRKYVVCNADEGDPGAFMDRSILEGDPHSILEAMAINGYCTGASHGLIYIRAEYPLAIERLRRAIEQAREYGLLGNDILGSGFSFDIELRYGAGAFVCGEETALFESIEGKRGEPRFRPPFPSIHGLFGKPTMLNNVETLANIAPILLNGAEWYRSIGTANSPGTKLFTVCGNVVRRGVFEFPMGVNLKDIIYEVCGGIADGKGLLGVQTGGTSGAIINADQIDMTLDIDTKQFKERSVLAAISSAKDKLITPEEFLLNAGGDFREKKTGEIYKEYQKQLKKNNALDFDDLIVKTVELFQNNPQILDYYQERFRYIMVDEYQDTNMAQFKLVSLLASKYRNLCVVGDDDQSIYRFRGADIQNILSFENTFPGTMVIKLEQNYRSTQNILDAANEVIRHKFWT